MPKEIIRNASQPGDDDRFHTEVRWSRDKYVQVATVKKTDNYATHGEVEGMFVDLDRYGINHLIRSLRKARDQAYGRDE